MFSVRVLQVSAFENKIKRNTWPKGEAKSSDFIWDFWKLPFPADLGKYIIKMGK